MKNEFMVRMFLKLFDNVMLIKFCLLNNYLRKNQVP
jgi:hypothetical protein